MTDAFQTPTALLDQYPDQRERNAGASEADYQRDRDQVQTMHRWSREYAGTRAVSGGQSADGGTQTIAVYQVDVSEAALIVGCVAEVVAAQDDQDLLADIPCYELDGTPMVALTADGQTYDLALCAILVDGSIEYHGVVGPEAADGGEVAPTTSQIRAALIAADITDHDQTVGLVVGRIKIQRVATDTITMTHTNVSTNLALALERAQGTLGGLVEDSGQTAQL